MYPQSDFDVIPCLSSLIGIRSACSVDQKYPFFIEDIEGVDISTLASVAGPPTLNGKSAGEFLIESASREMLADIELLLNNGYKLKEVVGEMCSNCSLLESYTPNTGIKIRSNISSRFKTLHITKLHILCDATGQKQIIIDDGVDPKYYTPTFQAGVISIVNINYTTTEKEVTIKFVDDAVGCGRISCAVQSSCGCGKSDISDNPATISGIIADIESSTQYGFLPCVSVGCSYEEMVCGLIKQTPNIFGLALFFKTAEKYYLLKENSKRNNETVSYNEGEKSELVRNYGQLYAAKLNGTGNRPGLRNVINDYLKTVRSDKCIICESKIGVAYATG